MQENTNIQIQVNASTYFIDKQQVKNLHEILGNNDTENLAEIFNRNMEFIIHAKLIMLIIDSLTRLLLNVFVFPVNPQPKIRMTIGDKRWTWNLKSKNTKKRKRAEAIKRYYDYKDELKRIASDLGYTIQPSFKIYFFIEMPKSWSKKKCKEMNGKPHQQTPDWDNLAKAFLDCLTDQDNFVYKCSVEQRWSEVGRIVVINP